jgi:transposase InsO family protein
MLTDQLGINGMNIEHFVHKGMILYRGKKELSIDAIKNNSYEISEIINTGNEILLKLKRLSTYQYELIKTSDIYSQKLGSDDYLFYSENFDVLVQQLNAIQQPIPINPTSTLAQCLVDKASENFTKVEGVDFLISELDKHYKSLGIKKGFKKLLTEACNNFNNQKKFRSGIHPSSYYVYKNQIALYQSDLNQYASSLHRCTFNQTRMEKTTLSFVDAMILKYILGDENRCTQDHVFNDLIPNFLTRTGNKWIDPEKCVNNVPDNFVEELLNLDIPFETLQNNPEKASLLSEVKLPSRTWFYNYVRWFKANPDQSEKQFRERYGDEFFEKNILSFDSYLYKAMYPLHYVFADHCLLDIFLVDEETRSITYKVWLTVLIDAYSRCIIGIALSEKSPCIESIQSAFKNALWPKENWLKENGIDGNLSWEFFGIPVNLSLDNAWAHHSLSLRNVINRLGFKGQYTKTNLIFRPPYKGRYGALVERYFGNIQGKIKELLLGAVKNREFVSIMNAKREACLLYDDLLQNIVKLIYSYHNTKHSELDGLTPAQKWLEGIEAHLPIVPPQNIDNEKLFWRSYHDTRVILQEGIHLFNMTYTSPGLSKAQVVDWNKKKVECGVSFDTNDISTLALYQNEEYVCEVKSTKLRIGTAEWIKMSLTELNIAKAISNARYKTTTRWLECYFDTKELNEQRKKEKISFTRKNKNHLSQETDKLKKIGESIKDQSVEDFTLVVSDFVENSIRR